MTTTPASPKMTTTPTTKQVGEGALTRKDAAMTTGEEIVKKWLAQREPCCPPELRGNLAKYHAGLAHLINEAIAAAEQRGQTGQEQ